MFIGLSKMGEEGQGPSGATLMIIISFTPSSNDFCNILGILSERLIARMNKHFEWSEQEPTDKQFSWIRRSTLNVYLM